MRVLHVLNPWFAADAHALPRPGGSDAAILLCHAAIQALPEAEHEVLVVGGSAEARRTASLGVLPTARFAPPLRLISLARRSVSAWLASRTQFDSFVAWDIDPASVGLRRDRASWVDLSRNASATDAATQLPRFSTRDRSSLRASLGLAESGFVLGLLADPPSRGDATRLIFLVSMLQIIGLPVVGLLHSASHGVQRATSEVRLAYTAPPPVVTDLSPAEFLPACDAAVLSLGSRFGGHSSSVLASEAALVALALQAGVPVVSPTPTVIPDVLHHACVAKSGHPGDVSRVLLPLAERRDFLLQVRRECAHHAPGDSVTFVNHVRGLVTAGATIEASR